MHHYPGSAIKLSPATNARADDAERRLLSCGRVDSRRVAESVDGASRGRPTSGNGSHDGVAERHLSSLTNLILQEDSDLSAIEW